MNKNMSIALKFDTAFWVLILAIIAIILGFKYKKQLGAIFSGISDMAGINK